MNRTIGHLRYSIGARKTNPSDKDSEKKFYPVAQSVETIDIRLLAKHMAEHGSPFSSGTIKGVLEDAADHAVELLRQGYCVKLDNLCSLRYVFKAKGSDKPEDVVPANVVEKVKLVASIDENAVQAMNSNIEYEYAMTRAAQAAAKKAAKEKLAADGKDHEVDNDDNDSEPGGGGGGDVTE